jgi:hypothetical protein
VLYKVVTFLLALLRRVCASVFTFNVQEFLSFVLTRRSSYFTSLYIYIYIYIYMCVCVCVSF